MTLVAVGRVTNLQPGVPFYGTVSPDLVWVGTPTTLKLNDIALDRIGGGENREVTFLQPGGSFDGTTVEFVGEPLAHVGTNVLVFLTPPYGDPRDPSEYWTMLIAEVDGEGRPADGAWSSVAPFLDGMTVSEILASVRASDRSAN
jgi:hypothetical protein